jgi:hypothetical protein
MWVQAFRFRSWLEFYAAREKIPRVSVLPVGYDFKVYHGDTWSQTFALMDGTTPHDLTQATLAAAVEDVNGATTTLGAATTANPGEVTITPPTGGLPPGNYAYDVRVKTPSNTTTWVRGVLRVQEAVAHV